MITTTPEMSDQINELAAALVAAQGEFSAIPKDSANPFFKSKYASLATVVATASPVLAKHGLAVSQFISSSRDNDGTDLLTTWLIHKSGQFINDTLQLKLTKDDAQGQGSATTYARRYAYMAVLGLVADEDDDGNGASPKTPYKPAYKPRQAPPLTPASINNDLPPLDSYEGTGSDEDTRVKTAMAVSAERVRTATVTRLGGVLQFKGISDQRMRKDILNELAKKEYGAAGVLDLDEAQANELSRKLANPKTNKEELIAMIDPFAPID